MSENWAVISAYTRKQAVEDGVLIDITCEARAHGFALDTVVTGNLFHKYIEPPDGLDGEGQSIDGRLHDLLMVGMVAAKKGKGSSRVQFQVLFLMRPGFQQKVTVIGQVGPGDEGEPVLTIMLPEDD